MKRDRTILRVLRAAREPRITQSQLARRAGLSASRYWQIEHGEGSMPSAAERAAVANALGVSVDAIAWPTFEKAQAS
jgi:transcriptional regulator with XRE-family HTH domain